jgi:hypothetical protein
MAIATSTIAALAFVGGLGAKQLIDGKKAKGDEPKFEPPPVPQYERPRMADAIKRQRLRATGASGRAGTIKTGPSGIPKVKPAEPKQQLGA